MPVSRHAWGSEGPADSIACSKTVCGGSGVTTFPQPFFHDLKIQCLVGHELLELPIFRLQSLRALRLRYLHAAELSLPAIQRLRGAPWRRTRSAVFAPASHS